MSSPTQPGLSCKRIVRKVTGSSVNESYVLDRHGCTDSESLNGFGLIRQHTVFELAWPRRLGRSLLVRASVRPSDL